MKCRLGLTDTDTGLFELLTATLVERMNQDLPFPFQAELSLGTDETQISNASDGVAMGVGIRIGDLAGRLRFLITDVSLESLTPGLTLRKKTEEPDVYWSFLLSAGRTELTAEELASIEPADVVFIERELAILFPTFPEKGWLLFDNASNLSESVIDKYFERFRLNETETAHLELATPDLASLPICLHAILGEKTMTLGDADALVPGAIVRLDGVKSDPVRIALNGKIAGIGELVELDGRLGVRILSWKKL